MTKANTYVAEDSLSQSFVTVPFRYHNLSLPLSLRFDTKIIYLTAGAYIDYLINRTTARNGDFEDMVQYHSTDRKLNLGMIFTMGLEKQFSKTMSFFVEGRVLENLTPSKENLDFTQTGFGYFNSGFAVGINYKFLKK
jgi:hypothetical protein